ncbi:MAG: MBL fold metallo-hydrolase [Pirellulales bacterium]|nr:MBL fold metallo-hydrolase [Pirellulales bacterium]
MSLQTAIAPDDVLLRDTPNAREEMQLGNWQLDTVDGGDVLLDGGACFGVVPKTVWGKVFESDDLNRIRLANNCVLARDGTHTVLIDTGYGGKYAKVDRNAYGMREGCPVIESLRELGVEREGVDTVVLGHLHFDHAGGATQYDAQRNLEITFPNANYAIHRFEWEDAISKAPELLAAYPQNNLEPLAESPQLRLLDDNEQIVPGLFARRTGGHTRGHTAIVIESGGDAAIYIGDVCPTIQHIRPLWCLSYDTFLLTTRRVKQRLLTEAAEKSWWVLWTHDPDSAASRIEMQRDKAMAVEPMATL